VARRALLTKRRNSFRRILQKSLAPSDFPKFRRRRFSTCKLRRLSALERQKIIDELEAILKFISELEAILANEQLLRQVIVDELKEVKRNFGDDARKTEIVDAGIELKIEDLIADEEVAITVTNAGYIKRTPLPRTRNRDAAAKVGSARKAKGRRFRRASVHGFDARFSDDFH
jgi:DNA gyrase subunit A